MRAPITASGRSEGTAKSASRLGVRSIFGASIVLGAVATAQGCGGSEFCAENSYECGNPNGGKAGNAGASGSTSGGKAGSGGTAGSAGKGSGGASSGGASGAAGAAGSSTSGSTGDGGESGTGATAGNGGEGGGGEPPPPVCDPSDLEDGCVPATGIFVSTSGDDDNDGTASDPLATISAAVTLAANNGAPIYVCGSTYAEHVVVTDDDLEIHGGFACPSGAAAWIYDSTKRPRVAPTTAGYALRVTNVSGLTVTDLEFESVDATEPGESSVAVFVSRSEDVALTRVGITAGDGVNGVDGTREGSNYFAGDLSGNDAMGNNGAEIQDMCMCPDGTASVGGQGGDGGLSPTAGGAGSPDEGAGQPGTPGACNTVGTGASGGGATAFPDGPGATTLGNLTASGWSPSDGDPGPNGTPGQGGGGGAGATTGGGGGGACGGCGGKGGGAGTGGGASIGIATFRSTISLTSVTIATGDAGDGGAGIEGEAGQEGGPGGTKTGLACNGGNGGLGADGAAGGGGAGGISVGILSSSDSTVTTDSTAFDIGMAGAAGPAAMGSTNSGEPGVAGENLDAG